MNCLQISNKLQYFNFGDFYCTSLEGSHAHRLINSGGLPKKNVDFVISQLGFCAIFSQRRVNEDLIFTVVPYKTEPYFHKESCTKGQRNEEEVWSLVKSVRNLVKVDKPIYFEGKQVFNNLTAARAHMVHNTLVQSSLVTEFIDKEPRTGRILDLGCGRGVNSIPLLLKGWNVTAIDIHLDALKLYSAQVSRPKPEEGSLNLIKGDITEYEFTKDGPFDLIICMDVLAYIDSFKLKSLLKKIQNALNPGGTFLGTLMFLREGQGAAQTKFYQNLGLHIYPNSNLIPEILKYSGFLVQEASFRYTYIEEEPRSVEFIAKKEQD